MQKDIKPKPQVVVNTAAAGFVFNMWFVSESMGPQREIDRIGGTVWQMATIPWFVPVMRSCLNLALASYTCFG